ncbi:hypothetical protein B0H13DRAFT_2649385 [Mycena leptocephala]|nr:hypothetical protein B0H13DRAFT_2649385 [Mycena leptocephala]
MPSLPDLPNEILTEIVKHYPTLYLGIDAVIHGVHSGESSGNDALCALSHTSRALRRICLPVIWERVHAHIPVHNQPMWKIKRRAKMLERCMQSLPHIVPYIHSLSITLGDCNVDNWQPMAQFVRVLQLLSNLRSLTILPPREDMIPVLEESIRGKVFPSVVSLVAHDRLACILRCFPNVQTLAYQDSYHWTELLEAAKDCCKHIHTIHNFWLSVQTVQCLREAIPRIQRLSLWKVDLESLCFLEGMDNLADLRIRRRLPSRCYAQPSLEEVVTAVRRVLHSSKATGRKELRIEYLAEDEEDIIRDENVILVHEPSL